MTERLEQRIWFRFILRCLLIVEEKEPSKPQESGLSPRKIESSLLLQLFRRFAYNESPTRALNTTSLKCCLPSTDVIDRQEKIHTCVWGFKIASCKSASSKSTRFSKKKSRIFFQQSSRAYMPIYSLPRYIICGFQLSRKRHRWTQCYITYSKL